ncbi:MAG: SRPBCC domain-containing protein [Acidobacteriota bacterium]
MNPLPYLVERSIVIDAERDTVFRFFTDPELWAKWWGAGSTVVPRVGGAIKIVHPNKFVSVGEVVEIVAPEKFAFTYSMQAAQPVPPEDSLVTLRLQAKGARTLVTVEHALADKAVADLTPQGWRFHFSLFANAVADYLHRDAGVVIDRWFALWTQADAAIRTATLREIAAEDVHFRDRYSCLDGIEEIVTHIGASQRFMPGIRLERRGAVRHCQGTALADWTAIAGRRQRSDDRDQRVSAWCPRTESSRRRESRRPRN